MAFQSLGRNCPVCAGQRSDCRENRDNGLIHCRADLNQVPTGWRYLKDDSLGFGMFSPGDGNGTDANWAERQRKADERRVIAQADFAKTVMSVAARHRHYRQLLTELDGTLNPDDAADLERRGVTAEQIKRWGIRSVSQYQKLIADYPINLPGISKFGGSLANREPGYIVPTRDPSGNVTSPGQVRVRNPENGQKYKWFKGAVSTHLPNGHVPLQVMRPRTAGKYQGYVGLCEGTGVKVGIAADLLGTTVIGAAGANFASGSHKNISEPGQLLRDYLEGLCKTAQESCLSSSTRSISGSAPVTSSTGISTDKPGQPLSLTIKSNGDGGCSSDTIQTGRHGQPETDAFGLSTNQRRTLTGIALIPDGGATSNPQVIRQYVKAAAIAAAMGLTIQVLWWGQVTKVDGDIDEITPAQFQSARLISWDEFTAIATEHGGIKAEPIQAYRGSGRKEFDAKAYAIAKQVEAEREWYTKLCQMAGIPFTEDRRVIATALHSRYLLEPNHTIGFYEPIQFPAGRSIQVLDGQKGTGKTSQAIASAIAQHKTGVVFVPTVLLARNASAELGIPTLAKANPDDPWVILCPESGWKIGDRRPECVVSDECNESFFRLQNGELGTKPKATQRVIADLMRAARTVVISSDSVYRPSLNAAIRLSGISADRVTIHQRRRRPTPMQAKLYVDEGGRTEGWDGLDLPPTAHTNAALYTMVDQLLNATEAGQRVATPHASRDKLRVVSRLLGNEAGTKLDTFDAVFTPRSAREKFADAPDEWLNQSDRPLGFSPLFNSGLSITGQHFDQQFEFTSSQETFTSGSQRGERIRDAIWGQRLHTRHIHFSRHGLANFPDPALFDPATHRGLINRDEVTRFDEAVPIANQHGLGRAIKQSQLQALNDLEHVAELADYLAIEAIEKHFHIELREAELIANGWDVERVEPDLSAAGRVAPLWSRAKESITDQQARIQAKCIHFENADLNDKDPAGPIAYQKQTRKRNDITWHGHPGLTDVGFNAAWTIDKAGGAAKPQRAALMEIAATDPAQWQIIRAQLGISQIATAVGGIETPVLVASKRDIRTVDLLMTSPILPAIIRGEVTTWDKTDPLVKAHKDWAIANSQGLADLTRHSQRINGLQFTESTSPVACVNRLLRNLLGLTITHERRVYRLQSSAEIATLPRQADPPPPKLRQLYRDKTRDDVIAHFKTKIASTANQNDTAWSEALQKAIAHNFSNQDLSITEVVQPGREWARDMLRDVVEMGESVGVMTQSALDELLSFVPAVIRRAAIAQLVT